MHSIFCSRRWGSSLPGLPTLTIRLAPHRHEENFSATHVCRVTIKHLPQHLISHIHTLEQLLKITPLSSQIYHSAGGEVGSSFFLGCGNLIFVLLKPHIKFQNLSATFENTPPLSVKNSHSSGSRGGPRFLFLLIGILIFL